MDDAIELYTHSREEALGQLYRTKELTQPSPVEMEADFEEVAASCGYFSFSLLDFANEMRAYLVILDDLKLEIEERPDGKTWNWLKVWRIINGPKPEQYPDDPGMWPFCGLLLLALISFCLPPQISYLFVL